MSRGKSHPPSPVQWGMGGMLSLGFVNVYFVDDGEPGGEWALIDTGLPWHFSAIVREARRRYGKTRPTGIYLTHGHYDHAGSAAALAAYWNVPVFAHEAELPFLTGQCDYPPADPSACGGWLSLASRFVSTHGRDLRPFVQAFPPRPLTVGPLGWEVISLPGHTPGNDYINAVAEIETKLPAPTLLQHLQQIEQAAGRERQYRNAPRTLDLDLLLYGSASIESANLVVPHPRMWQRAFVLVPLAEIAPSLVRDLHLQAVQHQNIAIFDADFWL